MNCLEFRKALLTEPARQSDALRAHAESCPLCRQFEQGSTRLERLLAEAAELPVPEGLEERILRRVGSAGARAPVPMDRRRFLAMAACVGTAAVGALGFIAWRQRDVVAETLVAHALHTHPTGLAGSPADVVRARAATRSLLMAAGVDPGPLDGLLIEDAWPCAPLGLSGAHLRLTAANGQVHVLLCPGEMRHSIRRLEHRGKHVELHPHPVGTLGLLATSPADLDTLRPGVLAAFRLGVPA